MYVYTSLGTPMKVRTFHLERCTSINSKYATTIKYTDKQHNTRRKYSPFTEKWKTDFYFLAKDFQLTTNMIIDIVYDVVSKSKKNEDSQNLYIRATNKLYDLI